MTEPSQWSVWEISDSDEPEDHVLVGMRHQDFDGVLLLLVPDGDPSDTDWYGTPRTTDGRPTRPILLFYKGQPPSEEDGLIRHVAEVGAETISRMDGVNETLKRMTQTSVGEVRLRRLHDALATPLGRNGLEEMRSEISPQSSLYDAYNHITFVSQRKPFGSRWDLEMIAGGLLSHDTAMVAV